MVDGPYPDRVVCSNNDCGHVMGLILQSQGQLLQLQAIVAHNAEAMEGLDDAMARRKGSAQESRIVPIDASARRERFVVPTPPDPPRKLFVGKQHMPACEL